MESLIIYQGNDEQVILQLWEDEEKTIPINIDNLEDLEIRIAIGTKVLAQFNKAGSGDFEALHRIDAYKYYLWFQTTESTKQGFADMWIEIKESNPDLDDSIDNTVRVELNMFNIQTKNY